MVAVCRRGWNNEQHTGVVRILSECQDEALVRDWAAKRWPPNELHGIPKNGNASPNNGNRIPNKSNNGITTHTIDLLHGHTESMINAGLGDVGIVVCETGATIRDHGLDVFDTLQSSEMAFVFPERTYRARPRFFRALKSALDAEPTIYFYSVDGPEGFMSNFYPAPFVCGDGLRWATSEHYYQAHKFSGPAATFGCGEAKEAFERVRNAVTPRDAYRMAWQYSSHFSTDRKTKTPSAAWLARKDHVMWTALVLKFKQNPALCVRLVATGQHKLVEHALKDFHYGCGVDGTGKNVLGVMLMQLREQLNAKQPLSPTRPTSHITANQIITLNQNVTTARAKTMAPPTSPALIRAKL
jgi:ribA/ribD-fused uncharacterized protein